MDAGGGGGAEGWLCVRAVGGGGDDAEGLVVVNLGWSMEVLNQGGVPSLLILR